MVSQGEATAPTGVWVPRKASHELTRVRDPRPSQTIPTRSSSDLSGYAAGRGSGW